MSAGLRDRALRPTAVSRAQVEDLLYDEAALLDAWRMDEWLELWTDDAQYIVPTNDNPDADPDQDLMYVNHDLRLLSGLVVRLKSVHAHREYPWSSTRHFVSNVRVLGEDADGDRPRGRRVPGLALPQQGPGLLRGALRLPSPRGALRAASPIEAGDLGRVDACADGGDQHRVVTLLAVCARCALSRRIVHLTR